MTTKSERFELRLNPDAIARVDKWRSNQSDLPSRSEAVRRLIDIGLGTNSRQSFMAMKFQILTAALSPGAKDSLSDAFIYAWEAEVYPFQDYHQEKWAEPFAAHFDVKEQEIKELAEHLDRLWLKKKTTTFCEIEDYCGVTYGSSTWNRSKLIRACRYMHLEGLFDESFRERWVEHGECPTEASSILSPFNRGEYLFLG